MVCCDADWFCVAVDRTITRTVCGSPAARSHSCAGTPPSVRNDHRRGRLQMWPVAVVWTCYSLGFATYFPPSTWPLPCGPRQKNPSENSESRSCFASFRDRFHPSTLLEAFHL